MSQGASQAAARSTVMIRVESRGTDVQQRADDKVETQTAASTDRSTKEDVSATTHSAPSDSSRAVYYEITKRMTHLYSVQIDAENAECMKDLSFIQQCIDNYRGKPRVAAHITNLGFIELCQHICTMNFYRPGVFSGGRTVQLICLALGVVAELTDRLKEACQRVLLVEFQKDLFEFLRADALDPGKVKFRELHCYAADCIMAILYNVIQAVTEARELYRDEGAVRVFDRYRTNTSDSVSCMALILQAYVINEDENALLGSDDRSFAFLAEELSTALKADEHRSRNGYKAGEVVAAVNKLAVNDENKKKIMTSGALTSYVELLNASCSAEEHLLAAQGLWTLALSCPEDVQKLDGCVEGLESLLKKSDNDLVKRQAKGALDALSGKDSMSSVPAGLQNTQQTSTDKRPSQPAGEHVFISYNHASKSTVLRLRDRLKSAGFDVWVDEEGVYESIADDIITGLEKSSVVLVCMSQRYYESPYCKKEVVYAAESYKKIIPLTLEPRYNPHGWLRFHTSDGLRYDFSSDDNFDDSFRKLLQVLKKVYKPSNTDESDTSNIESVQSETASQQAAAPPTHQSYLSQPTSRSHSAVSSWTATEVTSWLDSNGLHHLHDWFKGFDGELLAEYKSYRDNSPETLAACVQDERQRGGLTVADVMRLSRALKRL